MTRVTSAASERVTRVRALHTRSGRRKAGRFLVEGPQAVRAALDSAAEVHDLLVDEESEAAFAAEVDSARARGVRVTQVASRAMAAMAETEHAAGILAICSLLDGGDLEDVMARPGPVLVLEALADPGNVGTAIRTADAVGAAGVLLTPESADVHNGKVVRSTAGSLFHLPVLPGRSIEEIADAAASAGRVLAVATGDGAVDLFEAADAGRVDDRTCWVVGSEAHGVSRAARERAGVAVAIPMTGRAESLNAGVAAAVVLYVTRHAQRRLGGPAARMTD